MQTVCPSAPTLSRREKTPAAAFFPPFDSLTRPTVPTDHAAYYLDRKPQTLRQWACMENGPLRPIRVHGRLAWPVAEIRKLLGVQ